MYKKLKWIRVGVALIVILLFTLSFSYLGRQLWFLSNLYRFQFIPSFLSIMSGGALIFIFFLLLTFIFGRAYCSWICPLGIFQDVVGRIASLFKTKKQRRTRFTSPHNVLRYSIAGVVFGALLFGVTTPLLLTDPYSNYGRIAAQLFNPALQGIGNTLSLIAPNAVAYRPLNNIVIVSLIFAVAFFVLVTVMSALRGRLYCNTVCPVGTLMGLISKVSLFKLSIGGEKCVGCTLCAKNCKSECIDPEKRTIDESRCVACLNCTTVCKGAAIKYTFRWKRESSESVQGRREAIATVGALAAVVVARSFKKGKGGGELQPETEKTGGIVPPGGIGIEHLSEYCTSCHACIQACPGGIIKPATTQYGGLNFFLPVLSYKNQFCGFDCNKCSNVCPNGALLPLTLEQKRRTQIGKVKFIAKNCIVFKDKTDCGACDEHCPTKAITMKEWKGENGLRFPSVDRDICIGCGGCEYVCPATPKAMIIEPLALHGTSKPPIEEKQDKVTVTDFGF